MTHASLLEAFEALDEQRHLDVDSLNESEHIRWSCLRSELEQSLFQISQDIAADRRQSLRTPVCMAVRYWTAEELCDRFINTLSEGGLFVATDKILPLGTRMELDIELVRDEHRLKLMGEVVSIVQGERPEQRGMGLKFVDLPYEDRFFLHHLVRDVVRQRLIERRKSARLSALLPVQFVFSDGFVDMRSHDLSPGGLFVPTDLPFELDEEITMRIELPLERQPAFHLKARARHLARDPRSRLVKGIGFEFMEPELESVEAIQEYMVACAAGTEARLLPGSPMARGTARRHHARLLRRIPVRYSFDADKPMVQGSIEDLSAGGIFLHTVEPLQPGQTIRVDIDDPTGGSPLHLHARVVRICPPRLENRGALSGAGLRFVGLEPIRQARLLELLRQVALERSAS